MKTCLQYREGSSDKVYQVELAPAGGLFMVNFAFGRRGSTLNAGSKTPSPVDEASAKRIFEKLIREKKAKGYTEAEDGTPYHQPAAANAYTGIRPQLLNAIDETEASRLIGSADWCLQEKKDGRRLLIRKEHGIVRGINRRGFACSLAEPIMQEVMDFEHDFIIDGEAVGDQYFVFDLLLCEDRTWMLRPYLERLEALAALFGSDAREHVLLLETIVDPIRKAERMRELQQSRAEGVVFKNLAARYTPDRPASGGPALKFKFTATVSCIVAGVSAKKRSVSLALFDGGVQRPVGNVTIPPNHIVPPVGEIVDVRYLYAFPNGGSLFQPVYQWRRDDLEHSDCTVDQLKFKATDGDVDDQ